MVLFEFVPHIPTLLRAQEQKAKRNAIEGAEPWRAADEARFNALCAREMRGLTWAAVKQ